MDPLLSCIFWDHSISNAQVWHLFKETEAEQLNFGEDIIITVRKCLHEYTNKNLHDQLLLSGHL